MDGHTTPAVADPPDPEVLAQMSTAVGDLGGQVVEERDGIELRLVRDAYRAGGFEREAGVVELSVETGRGEQLDLPRSAGTWDGSIA